MSNWFENTITWFFVSFMAFPFWTFIGIFLGIFTEWQLSFDEMSKLIFEDLNYPDLKNYGKMPSLDKSESAENLNEANNLKIEFEMGDKNKDGFLDEDEFINILKIAENINQNEAKEAWIWADKDRNDKINYKEWFDMHLNNI